MRQDNEDEEISRAFRIYYSQIDLTVTPFDKIDAILEYLYERKDKVAIWDYHIPKSFEKPKRLDLTRHEIASIVEKLKKEGYVDMEEEFANTNSNSLMPHYKINFDGILLYFEGGYAKKKMNENQERQHSKFMEKLTSELQFQMASLTFWLVLIGLTTILFSGLTFYYQFFHS
jgi:hypothetical protein